MSLSAEMSTIEKSLEGLEAEVSYLDTAIREEKSSEKK